MRIKYFNRYELKYVISHQQADDVMVDLADHLVPDPNNNGNGNNHYTVTSLYYDTADYKAYWDKVEGHCFRRKLRVRVYNDQAVSSEDNCFVEIKQRNNKVLQKKRIYVPYCAATALCELGEFSESMPVLSDVDQAVAHEVQYLTQALKLQPACIVSYDRTAYNGHEQDVGLRITFDTNLKCRTHALSLLKHETAENHFFLPPDWCILEVKVNQRVPYWLSEVLSKHRCTLRRVSKYCTALATTKEMQKYQRILA